MKRAMTSVLALAWAFTLAAFAGDQPADPPVDLSKNPVVQQALADRDKSVQEIDADYARKLDAIKTERQKKIDAATASCVVALRRAQAVANVTNKIDEGLTIEALIGNLTRETTPAAAADVAPVAGVTGTKVAGHLGKARELLEIEDFQAAFDEVNQALALDKNDEDAKALLAQVLKEDDGTIVLSRIIPEVKLNAVPFTDAVDYLRNVWGARIDVKWNELETAGIDKGKPVSCQLKSASLDHVLSAICGGFGTNGRTPVGYVVDDGTIVISTVDSLDTTVVTHFYDVSDITSSVVTHFYDARDVTNSAPRAAVERQVFQELERLIQTTVDYDTWKLNNPNGVGQLSDFNGQLIVTQTKRTQASVRSFLVQLHKKASPQLKFNIGQAPADSPAPDVTLKTVDGGSVRLSDLKGHVVVMDFWATWCAPCLKNLPHIQQLADNKVLAGKGLVVWAVNCQEDQDTVAKFLADNYYVFYYTFTVPMDIDGAMAQAYGVKGIPTTVIVGKDGKVANVFVGHSEQNSEDEDAAINKALEQKNK